MTIAFSYFIIRVDYLLLHLYIIKILGEKRKNKKNSKIKIRKKDIDFKIYLLLRKNLDFVRECILYTLDLDYLFSKSRYFCTKT